MPGSLLFGVVTALLRFVPYVGAWIAALMAMVMAAAVSPEWWMTAGAAGLFFCPPNSDPPLDWLRRVNFAWTSTRW